MENSQKIQIGGYILLGVVILVVIYKISQFIKSGTDSLGLTMSEQEKNDEKQNLSLTKVDTKKLSFTKDSYTKMANQIYKAVKGVGTDNANVIAVIGAMKNQDDWNMTIQSFGIRDNQNMVSWLRDEYKYNDKLKKAQLIVSIGNPLYAAARLVGLANKVITHDDLNKILQSKKINQNLI